MIDLLQEQVALVRAAEAAGALEKVRTIGFLAGVALKAIEAGNLAVHIEMLERVLKAGTEGVVRRMEGSTERMANVTGVSISAFGPRDGCGTVKASDWHDS